MLNPKSYGDQRYLRRSARSRWLTTSISISLVLFLLGIFLLLAFFAQGFGRAAREAIVMRIYLSDDARAVERENLRADLATHPCVKTLTYIDKASANQRFLEEVGEDVTEVLEGLNPFPASFDLNLVDSCLSNDSLPVLTRKLAELPGVIEVDYPSRMLEIIRTNADRLTWLAVLIGSVAVLIAVYLISTTIRMQVFADRMNIRTMQLIGATRGFIRRPFLIKGFFQGVLAGFFATAFLFITTLIISQYASFLGATFDLIFTPNFIGISAGIVLLGALLGIVGSYLAVSRYLDRNLDELMR